MSLFLYRKEHIKHTYISRDTQLFGVFGMLFYTILFYSILFKPSDCKFICMSCFKIQQKFAICCSVQVTTKLCFVVSGALSFFSHSVKHFTAIENCTGQNAIQQQNRQCHLTENVSQQMRSKRTGSKPLSSWIDRQAANDIRVTSVDLQTVHFTTETSLLCQCNVLMQITCVLKQSDTFQALWNHLTEVVQQLNNKKLLFNDNNINMLQESMLCKTLWGFPQKWSSCYVIHNKWPLVSVFRHCLQHQTPATHAISLQRLNNILICCNYAKKLTDYTQLEVVVSSTSTIPQNLIIWNRHKSTGSKSGKVSILYKNLYKLMLVVVTKY